MLQTISVATSGAALSLLLYENTKSRHDQNGFLLGDIVCKESRKLTDAEHRVVNMQRIINVKSILPCPQQYYFYNNAGEIDESKLKSVLENEMKNVVGWYIFKRKCSSPPKLSFREKIIHKRLTEYFEHPAYFSCCLLTSDCSKSSANYSFTQTFVRYNMPEFENLQLHINNLSDPNFKFKSAETTSKVLSHIIKTVKNSKKSESLDINVVQDNLQEYIKQFVNKLPESENQLFELEEEIKELKRNLQQNESNNQDLDDIKEEVMENGNFATSSDQQNFDRGDVRKKQSRSNVKSKIINNVNEFVEQNENPSTMRTRSKKMSYSDMLQKK